MPEIGATLREARMHARIDVSEIEAQTKIRAKYLRALENEEWSLLPGPTFVKSFLRTYAQALGLDGKALVEEYRLHHERPSESMLEPIVSSPQRNQGRSSSRRTPARRTPSGRGRPGSGDGPSRRYMIAVGAIGVVIVALIVLLASGGGGGSSPPSTSSSTTAARTSTPRSKHKAAKGHHAAGTTSSSALVALSLKPTAVVYVCLIGDDGRKLIPGLELQPGESTATYHARRFEITLGNDSVKMYIDGTPRTIAPSSQAIGYSITKAHGRQPLASAQQPTCTT
jgi:cytoskeleton protein RodZ